MLSLNYLIIKRYLNCLTKVKYCLCLHGYCRWINGSKCYPFLHKYGFNCHRRMVWLSWLLNLALCGTTLSGVSFESTSEVWTTAILEWLKFQDWLRGHLQWHDVSCKSHENLPNGWKVINGRSQTAWWSHKSYFSFLRKVGSNRGEEENKGI
jgi:hypothetical protein